MKYNEKNHTSHPCKLHMTDRQGAPYVCDGCNQIGLGLSFSCKKCNYDLHPDCISATSSMCHPFYKECNFKFYDRPPGERQRFCDACGDDVKGFVYHCDKSGRDLHPCCSKLPNQIEGEGLMLCLQKKLASKCSWCGKRRLWDQVTGWCYVSTCDDFHFHVNCVREMLVKSWERSQFNSVDSFGDNRSLTMERRIVTRTTGIQDNKYWRMAKLVIRMIAATITGDPSAAIVWLVESLVSSA